ncbi:unnamed protein product [Blepharisma stoltei]|uniref:Uncharacterized protein n=1 Tax=Blepharisma stoltei TaxID=1481888 RepID=A0AAU9JW55_9CILI|nr:unnamed protein product [Blepharisma stoltei]
MLSRNNSKHNSGRYFQKKIDEDELSNRYHMRKEQIWQEEHEKDIEHSNILTCQKIEEDWAKVYFKRKSEPKQDYLKDAINNTSNSIAIQTIEIGHNSDYDSEIEYPDNSIIQQYIEDQTLCQSQEYTIKWENKRVVPKTPKQVCVPTYRKRRTKTLDLDKLFGSIPIVKASSKYCIKPLKTCKHSREVKSVDLSAKPKSTKKRTMPNLLSKESLFERSTMSIIKKRKALKEASKIIFSFRSKSELKSTSFIKEKPASQLNSYRDEDGMKLRDLRKLKLLENLNRQRRPCVAPIGN